MNDDNVAGVTGFFWPPSPQASPVSLALQALRERENVVKRETNNRRKKQKKREGVESRRI